MKRSLPWIVSAVFLAYVAAVAIAAAPRSARGVDMAEFGRLPIVMSGGVHSIDTAARLSLRRIRGTERVPIEAYSLRTFWRLPRTIGATEWLLEVLTAPEADTRGIFAVGNGTVAGKLGLPKPRLRDAYYTFAQLQPKLAEIGKEAVRIEALDAAKRAAWERDWLALRNAINVYARLRTTLQPAALKAAPGGFRYDFGPRLTRYQQDLKPLAAAAQARARGSEQPLDPNAQNAVRGFASAFVGVAKAGFFAMVPPVDGSKAADGWQTVGAAIVDSTKDGRLRPAVAAYGRISGAFAAGQRDVFDREVARYRDWLRTRGFAPMVDAARSEYRYTTVQPFLRAAALYLVAAIFLAAALVRRSDRMRRVALPVFALGAALHAFGLFWLVMIAGGLPPMNAYIGALSFGLVITVTVAAAALMRLAPLVAAPVIGLAAIAIAQGSAGGVLRLGREVVDLPLALAVAAVLGVVAFAAMRTRTPVAAPAVGRRLPGPRAVEALRSA